MTTLSDTAAGQVPPVEFRKPPYNTPHHHGDFVNVGPTERTVVGVAGVALGIWTLTRRDPSVLGLIGASAMIARAATGYCPAYHALGINTNQQSPAQPKDYFDRGIHVEVTVTIGRPTDELFRFWRDFGNLPAFMRHLQSVRVDGPTRSHWVAKAPAGLTVEWDAEIIHEEPGRLIAWRSLANADVDNSGSVRFIDRDDGRGTEVRVVIEYIPPAGRLGSWVASLFGEEPEMQVRQDLRRFKQLMETGEVARTEDQPSGCC